MSSSKKNFQQISKSKIGVEEPKPSSSCSSSRVEKMIVPPPVPIISDEDIFIDSGSEYCAESSVTQTDTDSDEEEINLPDLNNDIPILSSNNDDIPNSNNDDISNSNNDDISNSNNDISSSNNINELIKCSDYNEFKHQIYLLDEWKNNNCISINLHKKNDSKYMSTTWDYFGQLTINGKVYFRNKIFCTICFENSEGLSDLKCKAIAIATNKVPAISQNRWYSESTSTSNSSSHLLLKHQIKQIKRKSVFEQRSISDIFEKKPAQNKKSVLKFNEGRKLALMIAESSTLSFDFIDSNSFLRYMQSHIPIVTIPSAKSVRTDGLNFIAEHTKEALKSEISLNSPNAVSIVMDFWTCPSKRNSYVNYTIHYSTNFEIKCYSLKTEFFSMQKTGANIAENIFELFKEFKIIKKKITFVTDGGRNIIAAINILQEDKYNLDVHRIGCFAHSLHNLIYTDIFNSKKFKSEGIEGIIRKISTIYRKLCYKGSELKNINNQIKNISCLESLKSHIEDTQQAFDFDDLIDNIKNPSEYLKISNITRWNSTFEMLKSFSTNAKSINILLNQNFQDLVILPNEKQIIIEMIKILNVFVKASKILQGKVYPTLNAVLLFLTNIDFELKKVFLEIEYGTSIEICQRIQEEIERRIIIHDEHIGAALLDPVQKNCPFILQQLKLKNDTVEELINRQLRRFHIDNKKPDEPFKEKISKKAAKHKSPHDFKINLLKSIGIGNLVNQNQTNEIEEYMNFSIKEYVKLEDWWESNKGKFPTLYELANIYCGIPASSSSSETAFSVSGSIMSKSRAHMCPERLSQRCLVQQNAHLLTEKGIIPPIQKRCAK